MNITCCNASCPLAGAANLPAQSIDCGEPLDGSPKSLLEVEEADTGRDAFGEAIEFLKDYLAGGAKPAKEIYEAGDANGHAKITLKRAKGSLGAKAIKVGLEGGWCWELPQKPKGIIPDDD